MKRLYLFSLVLLAVSASLAAQAERQGAEILKSIVKIQAVIPKDARSAQSLGTEREGHGVVIDEMGHILTIGYLVSEAERIEITLRGGKKMSASFVGYDFHTGFGLLRADGSLDIVPMKLGDSSRITEGDQVVVAGFGGADAAQGSRVLSRREFAGYWEYLIDGALFTSPPYANFGGAALIDKEGSLIGIGSLYTQTAVRGLGIVPSNMFVPINLLKPILFDLTTYGSSREKARPWIGINAEESHGRVFLSRITEGGPAEAAGLRMGDLVVAVEGEEVKGLADFYRKIWGTGDAGAPVPLKVLRGSSIIDVTVRSRDRSEFSRQRPRRTL